MPAFSTIIWVGVGLVGAYLLWKTGIGMWHSSPDRKTWTFFLRADARWSNGDPVTARDYVWAYRRMLTASLGAEYASMLFCLRHAEAVADLLEGRDARVWEARVEPIGVPS